MDYNTDKIANGLLENYKTLFSPLQYRQLSLLEIGVLEGGSLHYWDDYFQHPETSIVGLDLNLPQTSSFSQRVKVIQCDQNDGPALERVARQFGPFDIVIDDGSHARRETEHCFRVLFPEVATGGYYIIEDWAAGYWRDRPHYQGMVELINDIIARIPELSISECRIILEKNKALAIFRKGAAGWRE
ncbi:MAG TPA: class I SAM-dependent methyltransferase [Proteobacteria bacterium]|nr:class I SAM-dependent methyltransferase [Pseudomonadota bacterium]